METEKNHCTVCKREFVYNSDFKRKYPHSSDCFCGRKSCMRLADKRVISLSSGMARKTPLYSFSKDPTIEKHTIRGFRDFDRRRRVAVQELLNRNTKEGERLFVELLSDMLPNGISKEEFVHRKVVFDQWLHKAKHDGRVKNPAKKDPVIADVIVRLYAVLDKVMPPSEYRTRSVWKKIS